jgi:hypothetical protein
VALKKAVWFKWAARIWGLGKLTTSILQSGLFCNFTWSTLIILIVALISTLSTVTFKMASKALPTKKGRGRHGSRNIYPGIKIFRYIVGISQQRRGVLFSLRYQGFSSISIVGKIILLSMMYKSTL